MDTDFEQLYATYFMQVYSFVVTLCKDPLDAEEFTQKAFFRAMTTRRAYRGDASELTWLCAIAKNLFLDAMRAQKRLGELSDAATSEICVENALVNEDSAFRIHQALHNLEEPYKEVFQLRVFGELPFEKIGRLFCKTENWARITYHRARLRIQERMENS